MSITVTAEEDAGCDASSLLLVKEETKVVELSLGVSRAVCLSHPQSSSPLSSEERRVLLMVSVRTHVLDVGH